MSSCACYTSAAVSSARPVAAVFSALLNRPLVSRGGRRLFTWAFCSKRTQLESRFTRIGQVNISVPREEAACEHCGRRGYRRVSVTRGQIPRRRPFFGENGCREQKKGWGGGCVAAMRQNGTSGSLCYSTVSRCETSVSAACQRSRCSWEGTPSMSTSTRHVRGRLLYGLSTLRVTRMMLEDIALWEVLDNWDFHQAVVLFTLASHRAHSKWD